jgi:hypothetical protein
MRPILAAALALACACAGYTRGEPLQGDGGGIPVGGGGSDGGSDAGDAGTDGGDAGSDAGCNGAAFGATGNPAFDGCFGFGTQTAFVSLNGCNVTISFGTTQICTGAISGAQDAFDGGCQALACNSPSLPGRITCATGCQVNICDAGGSCGP